MTTDERLDPSELKLHDRLIEAMVKILSAYSFQVQYTVKRKRTPGLKVMGDSSKLYYPDIIAEKGPWKLVVEARTRGQRGRSDEVDPGAVQLTMAELADMQKSLKRPHGMIVTPHGIQPEAKKLADHFGIIIGLLPINAINRIEDLDLVSNREKILDIAKEFKLIF